MHAGKRLLSERVSAHLCHLPVTPNGIHLANGILQAEATVTTDAQYSLFAS